MKNLAQKRAARLALAAALVLMGTSYVGTAGAAEGSIVYGLKLDKAGDVEINDALISAEAKGSNVANIAVGVQENSSHVTYKPADGLQVYTYAADGYTCAGASVSGMLLSSGTTAINASEVKNEAYAISTGAADTVAEGVKLTNHTLNINATAADKQIRIYAATLNVAPGATAAVAASAATVGNRAVAIDAANAKINLATVGMVDILAENYLGDYASDRISSVTAVKLADSELNVKSAKNIYIIAYNQDRSGEEYSLQADGSIITLDAGGIDEEYGDIVPMQNRIALTGRVCLTNSKLQLLSNTTVGGGIASDGILTLIGDKKADGSVTSSLYLMQNAKIVAIANNADFKNSAIHFYDDADINDSYLGVVPHPEYAQKDFRKITVGRGLILAGDNTLFIRTNSLAKDDEGKFADVGDRIIVRKRDGSVQDGAASAGEAATADTTLNINVFDEGMKTGYNGTKDGAGWTTDANGNAVFDGKAFGDNEDGAISVIKIDGTNEKQTIPDSIKIGDVQAAAYDNGVWSYDYEVQAAKSEDNKAIQLTKVATTKAAASSAPKTASDANKAAAAAAVTLFGADETLHERLGDIRSLHAANEKDENVWAKYVGGRLTTDGLGGGDAKVKYNGAEFGYDSSVGNNWIFGVAGEYVKGSSTLSSGGGKVKTGAGAVYGTWLGDKGHHLDIVGKIGRVDSESTTVGGVIPTKMKGDFDANAYSLSVEYGYKYDLGDNWFVAPMARLSYVHMGSASYDVKALHDTMHAQNDSFNSLVLRAGARVGTKVSDSGSLYFKLAALYDFDGDVATTLTADGRSKKYETDLGGFGLEYGLGYDQTIGRNSSFYFDAERISGGDLKKDWGASAGLRLRF